MNSSPNTTSTVLTSPRAPGSIQASLGSLALLTDDWPDIVPDLRQPSNFQHLLDCLCYALAIDGSVCVAAALGLPEGLCNQDALSIWVSMELQGLQFMDGSALFNFLLKQLDSLADNTGGAL